ncbi:ATP phosphoribosyltransferase regulatory subunit [Eilatimonas milleporae]|uniref:ATP phosphoribosyltransferase regulatory subunit n=1 Tax=Eilatimonas milleporae TaxID=911205 RepID=A0A3M0D6E0_9PROT|nr:ATP phosphoribosyltransferase regulatory subunit [Eilatimonas milleporae]RMB11843.1 ATP phosphoribosyltransferase regulatory subunit [Eilatimonas milleporae]
MIKSMAKNAAGHYARRALLPEGFRDQLAPRAEQEGRLVSALMETFLAYGYDRVAPPLVEYEDSILFGPGAVRAATMFRLMDPDTQRPMALRGDITGQMSRLAATRLKSAPRPLRLAYAGNVLRTKGSQVRPTRQFIQAGVELIGSASLEAEVEVIALAVASLKKVGIAGLSLDLTLAPLVGLLVDRLDLDAEDRLSLIKALDAKDVGGLSVVPEHSRDMFTRLIGCTGPADTVLPQLRELALSGAAGQLVARLGRLIDALDRRLDDVRLTVDPCETHGFEYKSGIGFALFSASAQGELARGGRYLIDGGDDGFEESTGFSVYLDSLMASVRPADRAEKIFLPFGTGTDIGAALREDGHRTVAGLTEVSEPGQEARRLGCSHIWRDGTVRAL